jgi:hypothetical protein
MELRRARTEKSKRANHIHYSVRLTFYSKTSCTKLREKSEALSSHMYMNLTRI